jgi:predicted MPP superfamily phosphohydrolase
MSLFLLTFFLIYGAVHCYAFLKTRSAFAPGNAASIIIILFMLVMTFAPFIIFMAEKHGFDRFARFLSYTGYTWMGMLFLFFAVSLVIDVFRLFLFVIELISKNELSFLKPSVSFSFFVPVILSLAISGYGYFEARNIRTERLRIQSAKLPEDIQKLTIVQISDIHLGLIVREKRLHKILEAVKKANPDLLVSTGDLVDGQIDDLTGLYTLLQGINPPYGKYAITGNHEFYAGLAQALDFTKNAGFTILRGQGVTIKNAINIVGVDDRAGKPYGLYRNVSEKDLLSQFDNGKFTLFLKHRPLINAHIVDLFDLQLSGHTHKGQIFPFSLFTKFSYLKHAGYLKLSGNSFLYVSRGAGTWGPPIRFLSPPEVAVIEIINENVMETEIHDR